MKETRLIGFGVGFLGQPWAILLVLAACLALLSYASMRTEESQSSRISFEKLVLSDRYFCDGINAGDINRDGHMDVVAGPYWYAGPGFSQRHVYYPPVAHDPAPSPSDNMFTYIYDFNRDQWPDILVLGRVHLHQAFWYQNPGLKRGLWEKHFVFERVRGESPPFVDIDGDGHPQLICHWNNRWGWIEPDWQEPGQPWQFYPISNQGNWNQFYHGTGVGDLSGDGRLDLVINDGWWEQPGKQNGEWTWHPFRFGSRGGAQMLVDDIDGDGDPDVFSSLDAHGWGLAWFERLQNGLKVPFRQHLVMGDRSQEKRFGVAFSQPHALDLADLDGDGLKDIVTGKRMWAHGPEGDVEPNAAPVLYWFRLKRRGKSVSYQPYLVDDQSGVGVQVVATDVNQDGRPDILSASKKGSFVFLNRGLQVPK